MPTGGYFLLDAAKTFAAQEKSRLRLDDIARSFAPLLQYVFGVAKRAPASFALLCLEPE